ncbi:glycosyltransferase [Vibrio genomosp. F6]|uniref:glycosyltransferase n=1 Tax=Vibrio genomosp. F6 TaxID=723172 RepID=UPI0010BD710B|nr:glycosyltransferase [Vibrio genomosp. F6]TKF23445.1 glycosyltransferase [Vibrio genomosp. F6]
MKKVVHIVGGKLNSGAALGALWLHKELLRQGVDSYLLVNDTGQDNRMNIIYLLNSKKFKVLNWLIRLVNRLINIVVLRGIPQVFSNGLLGYSLHNHPIVRRADVVNLHWINDGVISLYSISKIKAELFWTVRDMWPMTAGCHYSLECINYFSHCSNCPLAKTTPQKLLSKFVFNYKKKIINKKGICAIGISAWIKEQIQTQGIFENVILVPNFIDAKLFYLDSGKGIYHSDRYVVLIGAQNINDFYKGFRDAVEAVNLLSNEIKNNLEVVIFGKIQENIYEYFESNVVVTQHGFIDSRELNLLYNSADVFLMPSHMETFGKTILESLYCGLPVVAYGVTGQTDIIKHKRTGYLAEPYDIKDLVEGLKWVLENRSEKLTQDCAYLSKSRFSPSLITKSYVEQIL